MSAIEWTDATWNPVVGCTPVSTGCLNCYAAGMARRLEGMRVPGYEVRPATVDEIAARHAAGVTSAPSIDKVVRIAEVRGGRAVFTGEVRCLPDRLGVPLAWKKPRMVFVNSMSDLFHEDVPQHFIHEVLEVIRRCPQHTFQILTKRPERAAAIDWRCSKHGQDFSTLPNLWLGTSVEDQAAAEKRIPQLLRCPAAKLFLSLEPLVGPVQLPAWFKPVYDNGPGGWKGYEPPGATMRTHSRGPVIDWVIVGGESGPHARACDVGWIRSIVAQCKAAGVACFVKQLGARPCGFAQWHHQDNEGHGVEIGGDSGRRLVSRKGNDTGEWPEDLRVREMPGAGEGISNFKSQISKQENPLRLEDSAPPPPGAGEELSRGGGT